MSGFKGVAPPRQTQSATPCCRSLMFAQVYWLYTRAYLNKTDFFTCLLLSEVYQSVGTIKEHRCSELGHPEQIQDVRVLPDFTI